MERMGGQGYLSSNKLEDLIGLAQQAVTGQGDNRLLQQKIAREIFVGIRLKKYK